MSKTLSTLLALTLGMSLAQAALAQDSAPAAAPAPAAPAATADDASGQDLNMGQTAEDQNPMKVAGTFGSWEQRCIADEAGKDRCQLYQLLKDKDGNNVAEFSMFNLPAGQQAAAGATVIVPLETLLTANLSLKIDSSPAKVYPYTWCSTVGCVARIGFTQAEVDALKKGSAAQLTLVPVVAPDQKVVLDLSLSGFTAGYDAVVAANGK
ncbi:invasion associated locus B family protein [Falsirhodobacter sp. 20TX0035]|uniref:invasion associated locus B family protein n=1 Tax=Falsirhodobacter sp. 20TX0035 TaxID=3022019 RepID=UPI00232FCEB4|nr:invasion associated locus B family protein [Falsirhodobacter sp. 20TX0035]MDB6453341.1 invasion associated locus B family protein [Falsirhodobacter sp. 20TX0035]